MPQKGDRSTVVVTYEDGKGVLRDLLHEANALGCETTLINTRQAKQDGVKVVRAEMRFRSGPALREVLAQLSEVDGVLGIDRPTRDDEL
jgi:putative Mg2+ transporter-C (MgtC) family protein